MPVNISGNGLFTGASSINGLTLPTDSFSPGLVKITDQAFGTASSVSINNCFSATYNVYRIIIERAAKSGAADNFLFRLRANGTDATTNYTYQYIYGDSTSVTASRGTSLTSTRIGSLAGSGECTIAFDIFNPFAAITTTYLSNCLYGAGTPRLLPYVGANTNATSYDGITFFPESNAFSDGIVRIYGYRN